MKKELKIQFMKRIAHCKPIHNLIHDINNTSDQQLQSACEMENKNKFNLM